MEPADRLPFTEPHRLLSTQQTAWLDPPPAFLYLLGTLLYAVTWAVMRMAFRLRVIGRDHLPVSQCILASTHTSYLDPFALAAALPYRWLRRAAWGVSAEIANASRLNRVVCRTAQAVPLEEDHRPGGNVAAAVAALRQGRHLVWFPEGYCSPTGALQPLRAGIGLLLEHFHLPVVPVRIEGTFEALPRGRRWPRFPPITIIIGEPLDPVKLERSGVGDEPHRRITHALAGAMAAMAAHPRAAP